MFCGTGGAFHYVILTRLVGVHLVWPVAYHTDVCRSGAGKRHVLEYSATFWRVVRAAAHLAKLYWESGPLMTTIAGKKCHEGGRAIKKDCATRCVKGEGQQVQVCSRKQKLPVPVSKRPRHRAYEGVRLH